MCSFNQVPFPNPSSVVPTLITMQLSYIYLPTICMPFKYYVCQLLHVQISDHYVSMYTSYELSAIKYVTKSTGIHNFDITGTCARTNLPFTLHIYVLLHICCSLHKDSKLLHQSIKINKLQYLFTILLHNMLI